MLPERPDPLVGSMLGKDYRVLEPIGVGGMAVVYLVEHQTLLKQFAAKVLSDQLASSLEARARFTQEAHAASQLDHENIVRISDFGVTLDHRPFFVMELLRGKTLDQRLGEGRMSIEEVVAVCVPVARALAHAHAEGIVHLDVKPENIFLTQRSQSRWGVKVVDFGIAKTPLNPKVTKLGETNGSPLFMAPEMCRGDDDVDQRADVYSFGILLYLMMCGRLPFVDDSMHRVLQMQLVQLPPPPRQINSELSPELAAVVERALAKQRDDRYASMDALLVDLAAALPPGSDRLLIEAQSGTPAADTPFSRAMSMSIRAESQREGPITPPPMFASLLPRRKRSRPVLVALAAAVVTVAAAVAWRELSTTPSGDAGTAPGAGVAAAAAHAVETPAPASEAPAASGSTVTATPIVPGETGQGAEAKPPEESQPAAAESKPAELAIAATQNDVAPADSEPAPRAADPAVAVAAPVQHAKIERSAPLTKKPLLRPKPVIRPAPARPAKRGAPVAALASAPAVAPSGVPAAQLPAPAVPTAAEPAPETPAARPVEPEPAPPPAPPTEVARSEGSAASGPGSAAIAVKPVTAPPIRPATAPAPGALDATPSVASLEVKGSLSPSIVRRSMERTLASLRECYRGAARAGRTTPAIELRLTFEIDENSLATHVATSGAQFGSLASCVAGIARQIRTQEAPDVGTAQVTTVIRFRPL